MVRVVSLSGVIDDQGVPVEIEHGDAPAVAGYAGHLRQRLPGIGEVLQQPGGATYVKRCLRERGRLHVPDPEGNGELAFAAASPGFSDHGLARVEADKTARRADNFHQLEHIGPSTATNFEDCLARRESHPFQHEPLAHLDAFGSLRLIHEPDGKVRILGAVDLGEKLGAGMSAHADPPGCVASLACRRT